MSERSSSVDNSDDEEKKWWEKIPVLSHVVNAVLWMFGRK